MSNPVPAAPWPVKAPFSWFGGKSRVTEVVWHHLGDPDHYIEPCMGSIAMLLGRPSVPRVETVNDVDGMLANFWRAIRESPLAVAEVVRKGGSELDLWAWRRQLAEMRQGLTERLAKDPLFFDARAAAAWIYTQVLAVAPRPDKNDRSKPRARAPLMSLDLPVLMRWFDSLSARLRKVRILCGDWTRTLTDYETSSREWPRGVSVFLDPPYAGDWGGPIYHQEEEGTSARIRQWAIAHGKGHVRVALCGTATEHSMPADWICHRWKRAGGFSSHASARHDQERLEEAIWFSPNCLLQAS